MLATMRRFGWPAMTCALLAAPCVQAAAVSLPRRKAKRLPRRDAVVAEAAAVAEGRGSLAADRIRDPVVCRTAHKFAGPAVSLRTVSEIEHTSGP